MMGIGLASSVNDGVPPEAMKLHRDAIVADLHADTQFMITYMGYDLGKRHRTVDWGPAGVAPLFSDLDIPRMKEGGLDLFTLAICPVPKDNKTPGAAAFVRRSLNALDRTFRKYPDSIAVARSPEEARAIIASGRIAALLAIEGGSGIENHLDLLREFYNRGVRYMTITHMKSLTWAESSGDQGNPDIKGLSDFGKSVVKEMEKMGMMIDLAHVSEETFWAVLDTVDCPVIVTHAGARGLANHPRNLSDEQIKAVAARGGVIGVIFHLGYLDPAGQKPHDLSLVVDHMDYIKKLAGADVIALGSDFDGSVYVPPDLADASRLPALTAELLRRGYTEKEIRGILGENFLRAWEKIERYKE
jgi:membrane dipeptidase